MVLGAHLLNWKYVPGLQHYLAQLTCDCSQSIYDQLFTTDQNTIIFNIKILFSEFLSCSDYVVIHRHIVEVECWYCWYIQFWGGISWCKLFRGGKINSRYVYKSIKITKKNGPDLRPRQESFSNRYSCRPETNEWHFAVNVSLCILYYTCFPASVIWGT